MTEPTGAPPSSPGVTGSGGGWPSGGACAIAAPGLTVTISSCWSSC